jgi:hypothetical protein
MFVCLYACKHACKHDLVICVLLRNLLLSTGEEISEVPCAVRGEVPCDVPCEVPCTLRGEVSCEILGGSLLESLV